MVEQAQRSKYKLLSGTIGRMEDGRNRIYAKNSEILLTDDEARRLKSRVSRVGNVVISSSSGRASGEQGGSEIATNPWVSVLDQSAPGVIAVIQELQEKSDLAALIETEENGANRKGVLIAANKRMSELEEESGQ